MSIIETQDLRKSFKVKKDGKNEDLEAVKGISLRVDEGENFIDAVKAVPDIAIFEDAEATP